MIVKPREICKEEMKMERKSSCQEHISLGFHMMVCEIDKKYKKTWGNECDA
jgi:hypothetical protein